MKCGWFHRLYRDDRSGYRTPERGDYRAVAVRVREVRYVCWDCNIEVSPWKAIYRSVINSLTLDSNRMEQLERNGYLWD